MSGRTNILNICAMCAAVAGVDVCIKYVENYSPSTYTRGHSLLSYIRYCLGRLCLLEFLWVSSKQEIVSLAVGRGLLDGLRYCAWLVIKHTRDLSQNAVAPQYPRKYHWLAAVRYGSPSVFPSLQPFSAVTPYIHGAVRWWAWRHFSIDRARLWPPFLKLFRTEADCTVQLGISCKQLRFLYTCMHMDVYKNLVCTCMHHIVYIREYVYFSLPISFCLRPGHRLFLMIHGHAEWIQA